MNIQTIEDIKKLLEKYTIRTIEISFITRESKIFYSENNNKIDLYFSAKWCEENEDLLDKILIYIIQNHKEKRLDIKSGALITDEIIKEIAKNKNIEEVSFGNFFSKYTLKESDYLTLKDTVKKIESSDVEESLKYNFDEIIEYNRSKRLISYNNYNDLQKETLRIIDPIDDEHIEYLKYIGEKTELIVSSGANIVDIIEVLRKAGKNNKITYYCMDNKIKLNEEIIKKNINYENTYIEIGTQTYTLKEYVEYEKLLYSFIEPAKNLSPLEKYIYAYDVVKKFKKYKENKKDKMKARRLYDILNNNYMVCVAYSDMLGDLLDKLGIENIRLLVDVGLQSHKAAAQLKNKYKDKWETMEQQEKNRLIDEQKNYIPDSWEGHSRRLVHITDEKYGVDGIYFSDPTWDNDLENNSYNYLLMTAEEVLTSRTKFKFEKSAHELFYSSSVKEFNDKLNIILNRIKKNPEQQFKYIMQGLINSLKKLDNSFYNKLHEKYEFMQKISFKIENIYDIPEEITDCLYEIAQYITTNVNKKVDGKTILSAVKKVYDNIYENGISEEEIEEIRKHNSKRAERNFAHNKFEEPTIVQVDEHRKSM